MTPALAIVGLVAVLSVLALLWAYRHERQALVWPTKCLAAASFIVAAGLLGATDTAYGRTVLVGLVLCAVGDVCLIPRRKLWFTAGLAAFLAGHLAYLAAFIERGVFVRAAAGAMAPGVLIAAVVLRWLWPHVPGKLRAPVVAYVAAITVMVAGAVGTVVAHGEPLIFVGAFGFYLSDLAVARNRFVAPGFVNKLWGTPLYFAAQWTLALTV